MAVRTTLLLTSAVLALAPAGAWAQAQNTDKAQGAATSAAGIPGDSTTSVASGSPQSTGLAAEPEQTGIADIIVTAERRALSVQKTPLNISVIGGETLTKQGVTDPRTLLDSIPGMKMNMTNPNAYIGLYGLASGAGTQYTDPVMAFNYGGVPLTRQTSASSAFYDLERVEVLKGPQGTLYGRNATVGAINVIPARPTHDFAGGINLTLGNYATVNSQGFLNLPLSDTLSSRVAFQTTKHDGYYTNGYDDANNYGGRASLLWEPTSDLTVLLWGDLFVNRAKGPYSTFQYYSSSTQRWIDPNNPWFGLGAAGTCTNIALCPSFAPPSSGGTNVVSNPSGFANTTTPYGLGSTSLVGQDGFSKTDQIILSTEIAYTTPIGTLTVIPAFVHTKINYKSYSNGLLFGSRTYADQESIEARLSSNGGGKLKWTIGGFYFHEKQDAFQFNVQSTGYALLVTPDLIDKNFAFFGDATYSLNDRFRVTGGLRYTNEVKSQNGYITTTGVSAADVVTITGAGGTCTAGGTPAAPVLFMSLYPMPSTFCVTANGGSYKDTNISYKAGVEFDLQDDVMAYATVRTGYRAGGFTSGTDNTYKPEKPRTYELGLRSRFFDRRLQLNVTGFYWDYKDQQISQLHLYKVGGVYVGQTSYPSNYDGNFYGAEADIQAAITNDDRLSFDVLFTKGKYDSTPAVAALNQATTVPQYNLPRINLPEWTISAGYNHTFHLANGATVVPDARVHYESRAVLRIIDPALLTLGDIRDPYAKVDMTLAYNAPGARWTISAYVDNFTNKAVVGVGSSGQTSLPTFFRPASDPTNVRSATLDPPRTYGVRMSARF